MGAQSKPEQRLTPDEYLTFERAAETQHEYLDGFLVAMTGASRPHTLITVNIIRELSNQLVERPCELYAQDLRVRVAEARMHGYPDVAIVCAEPQFEDDQFDVLLNPTLVVEILCPSTERYDRGVRFGRFLRRGSLEEYVLIAQDRISIERHSRRDGVRVLTEATSLDETIDLRSITCSLSLRMAYAKVPGMLADG